MNKIGEKHGDFTIIAKSTKPAQGYLNIYWVKCSCGNIKRLRYDYIRKQKGCGMCEDFRESNTLESYLKELNGGKQE